MRRIMVTGSNGLLGHAVIERLAKHYRCIGFDLQFPIEPISDADYVTGDLRDHGAVNRAVRSNGVTDIIHSGAISHPLMMRDRPSEIIAVNVGGTLALLEAAYRSNVQRFVFISSAAVYRLSAPEAADEDSALEPETIYGASKAGSEMLVRAQGALHNLPFVILRPVSIYGPRRQTAFLPGYLLACALDAVPARLEGEPPALDYLYVEDAAQAVEQALKVPEALGQSFNIATGVRYSFDEVCHLIANLAPGSRIDCARNEPTVAERKINPMKAKTRLGFTAKWSLADGLAVLRDAYVNQPALRIAAREAVERMDFRIDPNQGRVDNELSPAPVTP